MTGFLERVVARALTPDHAVRPRLSTPFTASPAALAENVEPVRHATTAVRSGPTGADGSEMRHDGSQAADRPSVAHRSTVASGSRPSGTVPAAEPRQAGRGTAPIDADEQRPAIRPSGAGDRSRDRPPAPGPTSLLEPGPPAAQTDGRDGARAVAASDALTASLDHPDDAGDTGGDDHGAGPDEAPRRGPVAPAHAPPRRRPLTPAPDPVDDGELGRPRLVPARRRNETASVGDDEAAPTVHVRIGRIEVRAAATPPTREAPAPAVLPLEDYLRERAERRSR